MLDLDNFIFPASPIRLKSPAHPLDGVGKTLTVNLEAERDSQGRLTVAPLPPGDRGGSYEVAGINDRFDPAMVPRLAYLVRSGQAPQAEVEARNYIASQTDRGLQILPEPKDSGQVQPSLVLSS
jgi:hypothetical protein